VLQAQHRESDLLSAGAGESDYTDAAASGGSGNGDNGVVEVHGKIVAGVE